MFDVYGVENGIRTYYGTFAEKAAHDFSRSLFIMLPGLDATEVLPTSYSNRNRYGMQ